MSNTIFGYGSLILIESIIARFDDDLPNIDTVYENRVILPEEETLTADLQDLLTKHNNINIYPAKLRGFIRTYTIESPRGGAMFETYYTGRETDILNGLVITGLTDEQYEQIQSTESIYDDYTIQPDEFDFYVDVPEEEEISDCTLNLGGTSELSNWETQRVRHPTYHSRILAGIEQLSEIYDTEVRNEFWQDFTANTYEFPHRTFDLPHEELNQF